MELMGVFITDKDGKLKKVAGNFIPKESPNLDCLRTEVVYDMTSSDSNKNWDYPNGIRNEVVVAGKDFSKYEKLVVYAHIAKGNNGIAEIDLTTPLLSESDTYRGGNITTFGWESTTANYLFECGGKVTNQKTTFTASVFIKYIPTGSKTSNEYYYIYKIEGILKTPAMIYTGKELFEGNGIKIENGVISANEKESFLLTHPINSLYITEEEESPIDKYGGGWLKIGEGYTLWTASSGAGETISAGLPNISGSVTFSTNGQNGFISSASGAFSVATSVGYTVGTSGAATSSRYKVFNFNASKSSSIYGSSTTVQPPAYKVYIWKRIS